MAPAAAAPLAGVASMDWPALHGAVAACRACGLCQGRQHSVPGAGSRSARWLVLGDAPGEQDDAQGQPFAGPPGQLLGNMLRSAGLERADTAAGAPEAAAGHAVYLTHLVKCRPPGNRPPSAAEVAQCAPYLQRQIALVQPRVIVALGKLAAQALLQHSVPGVAQAPLGKLRGQVYQIANPETGQPIAVVVSYDPATLLRNLPEKAKAWADWCLALQTQQEPPSA